MCVVWALGFLGLEVSNFRARGFEGALLEFKVSTFMG